MIGATEDFMQADELSPKIDWGLHLNNDAAGAFSSLRAKVSDQSAANLAGGHHVHPARSNGAARDGSLDK